MRARWIVISLFGLLGWWWLRGEGAPRPTGAPQLAVLEDGFAVMHGTGGRRIRELEPDGTTRREHRLASLPEASRVIGARVGVGAAWLDDDQVQLGFVTRNGKLRNDSRWGVEATMLCDGVASNDLRFGVGWLEADGNPWVVYGPTAPQPKAVAAATAPGLSAAAPTTTWCAVASAEEWIVLAWRNRAGLLMTFCKDGCNLPARVRGAIADRPVLGLGCLKDGCVVATRGKDGLDATWVTRAGTTKWTRRLPGHAGGAVDVIGAGGRQLAIAYEANVDGRRRTVVATADKHGGVTERWRGDGLAPSLAWSKGRLAIARAHDGRVVTDVLDLPR